jgi:type I restriction enzyme R subunit
MSEAGYVELPILQWLSGHGSATPGDKGLGWTYRDEAAMAAFDRPLQDPLVETLLAEAILRINSHVTTPEQARLAIKALRTTMNAPDRLTANRETLDRLRDGVNVELVPGEGARTVNFIAFEPERQHLNDYTATNQYRVQGVKQCRDDTVLLVNGIPLVIAEYKSYLSSGKDWTDAVHQLHRYQRQAPLMLTPNVFCVAADEDAFRYGTVLFHDASKDDVAIALPGGEMLVERTGSRQPARSAGNASERFAAPKAHAVAGFSAALHRVRDEERQNH